MSDRKYREANREKIREYNAQYKAKNRERINEQNKLYMRQYYAENKEQILAAERERYQDPEVRERKRQSNRAWQQANKDRLRQYRQDIDPLKKKARWTVENRVRQNHWPPARFFLCSRCDSRAESYHHPDYNYPTWVEPLCDACHIRHHKSSTHSSLS